MYALSKTLGVLLLATLLTAFGSALAMWSETININTYIHTGEVRVAFGGWAVNDNGPDPQCGCDDGSCYDNSEGKDVASVIVTPEILDEQNNTIKLNVTIINGYPGYFADITFNVTNIGTIPVKLLNYTITGVNTTALRVNLGIPKDTQIHPNENGTYTLSICIKQAASEMSTYAFDISLTFAQWNEVPRNTLRI